MRSDPSLKMLDEAGRCCQVELSLDFDYEHVSRPVTGDVKQGPSNRLL